MHNMHVHSHSGSRTTVASKTLGPRSAELFTTLHERRTRVFTLSDAYDILDRSRQPTVRRVLDQMVDRGLVTRLEPGLYNLVPFELGDATYHVEDPLLIVRTMMAGRPYFISHGAAMEVHGLLTQPNLVVTVTSPAFMRSRTIAGIEYRFVRCQPTQVFGMTTHRVGGVDDVIVSNTERTIVDGLRRPELCGGMTEVAKAMWIARRSIDPALLATYARSLGTGAALRRLGYLSELYGIGSETDLDCIRSSLTSTYDRFDPTLPAEGVHIARWRLQMNVSSDELEEVVRA